MPRGWGSVVGANPPPPPPTHLGRATHPRPLSVEEPLPPTHYHTMKARAHLSRKQVYKRAVNKLCQGVKVV